MKKINPGSIHKINRLKSPIAHLVSGVYATIPCRLTMDHSALHVHMMTVCVLYTLMYVAIVQTVNNSWVGFIYVSASLTWFYDCFTTSTIIVMSVGQCTAISISLPRAWYE